MRPVAILGIGQTRIDEHWEKSLRELAGQAAFAALADAALADAELKHAEALYVGNMLSPIVDGQNQLGTLISDWIGMWGSEAVKIKPPADRARRRFARDSWRSRPGTWSPRS